MMNRGLLSAAISIVLVAGCGQGGQSTPVSQPATSSSAEQTVDARALAQEGCMLWQSSVLPLKDAMLAKTLAGTPRTTEEFTAMDAARSAALAPVQQATSADQLWGELAQLMTAPSYVTDADLMGDAWGAPISWCVAEGLNVV